MTIQDEIKSLTFLLESLLNTQEIHIDQVILLEKVGAELIGSMYFQIANEEWPLNYEDDVNEPDDPNEHLDIDIEYIEIIEPPEPDITDRNFFDIP